MTIAQIIVPVTPDKVHLLSGCLQSIKDSTSVDHVVNVVIGGAHIEDRVGEIVAAARAIYDRTGLVISVADPKLGYNGIVIGALLVSDAQYTLVVPCTHRIFDREWFGKMQAPHIKAPACGLTVAIDSQEANTRSSFRLHRSAKIESMVFLVPRGCLGSFRDAAVDLDATDLVEALRDRVSQLGAFTWAIPSVRVEKQLVAGW